MQNETYLINVAFMGLHNFTVTVDRNGPKTASAEQARFVKRNLEAALSPDYEVSMWRIETTRKCFPK